MIIAWYWCSRDKYEKFTSCLTLLGYEESKNFKGDVIVTTLQSVTVIGDEAIGSGVENLLFAELYGDEFETWTEFLYWNEGWFEEMRFVKNIKIRS